MVRLVQAFVHLQYLDNIDQFRDLIATF